MKLYAPSYYRSFTCIADRCTHSCCIGWEIDVDPDTLQKYKSTCTGYGKTIAESIEEGEAPHFRLLSGDCCPHLNGQGLCNIILSLGEEYLCEICREHPRFYQDTSHGKEVGLGMCCEEACRLILSHDPLPLVCIGECEGTERDLDFDASDARDDMLVLLAEKGISYTEKRKRLCKRYGVSPDALEEGDAKDLLESLEYLDPLHRKAFMEYRADATLPQGMEVLSERILSYFILRHCVAAESESEICAALCFSLFCEALIASIASKAGARSVEELIPICRTVSEEIEYSEENTDAIKTEFLFRI